MSAVQTIQHLPELSSDQAEYWVAAALAEARALRQYEDRDTEELRQAWRLWSEAADALLERLKPLLQTHRHIAGAYDLDYAIGRAKAMLSLSPQMLDERRRQMARGEVRDGEEVRRELRSAPGR